MGLSIGQTAANLAAIQSASIARTSQDGGTRSSESPRLTRPDQAAVEAEERAERTASPQALALRALNINLEEARRLVPSPEETQARFRAERAAQDAEAAREEQAERAVQREESAQRQLESLLPEPAPQARRFEQASVDNRDERPEITYGDRSEGEGTQPAAVGPNRLDVFA